MFPDDSGYAKGSRIRPPVHFPDRAFTLSKRHDWSLGSLPFVRNPAQPDGQRGSTIAVRMWNVKTPGWPCGVSLSEWHGLFQIVFRRSVAVLDVNELENGSPGTLQTPAIRTRAAALKQISFASGPARYTAGRRSAGKTASDCAPAERSRGRGLPFSMNL